MVEAVNPNDAARKLLLSPSTVGTMSCNDESSVGDAVREKCKDRIDNSKKQAKKTMPLSDQLDMRDPQMIAEFA